MPKLLSARVSVVLSRVLTNWILRILEKTVYKGVTQNSTMESIEKIEWEEVSHAIIDVTDPFCIHDIQSRIPYRFNSRKDVIDIIIDLRKFFAGINTNPKQYVIKDLQEGIPKLSFSKKSDAKEKMESIKITPAFRNTPNAWSWYEAYKHLFDYDDIKFYSTHARSFTTFRGYDLQRVDKVDKTIIAPFLDHVFHVICSKNEEVNHYITRWIASIIQIPNAKLETAIVIIGAMGTGKNLFGGVLCNLLNRYSINNIDDLDHIVGKFNAVIENKKLVVCNELASMLRGKNKNMDRLKSIITEKEVLINQKYVAAHVCDNVANFIFLSNNPVPLIISDQDRRFVVTMTSNHIVGNGEYFNKLGKLVEDKRSAFYRHLFTYYSTIPIGDFKHRVIPMTEAKEFIQEMSKSPYQEFIETHFRLINNIRGPVLKDLWQRFAKSIGIRPGLVNDFHAGIAPYVDIPLGVKWIHGKSQRVYNMKPDAFRVLDAKYPMPECDDEEEEDW